MARRRKKNKLRVQTRKTGIKGIFPGTLFGVLLALMLFSFSYLYICGRCDDLGKKINQLEKKRDELRREIVNEEFKWSNMTSPKNMEALLKKHQLNMIWPSEDSVVRLRRNPLPQQFAQGKNTGAMAHD
ncbi:MAG TPA: hypothetical protein PJ991_06430 [Kiritimatiellia bacterium]|nr:hypothetical protein [Kiritimatiellia bacterium]